MAKLGFFGEVLGALAGLTATTTEASRHLDADWSAKKRETFDAAVERATGALRSAESLRDAIRGMREDRVPTMDSLSMIAGAVVDLALPGSGFRVTIVEGTGARLRVTVAGQHRSLHAREVVEVRAAPAVVMARVSETALGLARHLSAVSALARKQGFALDTPSDAPSSRDLAEARVRELQLDRRVRAVARSGQGDVDTNAYEAVQTFAGTRIEVRATFGAGVEPASVSVAGKEVYRATGGGLHLERFHDGDWVADLVAWAEAVRHAAGADRVVRLEEMAAQEAERFLPLSVIEGAGKGAGRVLHRR